MRLFCALCWLIDYNTHMCEQSYLMAMRNQPNERGDSSIRHPVGSWGRFTRRLCRYSRHRQEENQSINDTIWFYVAISVLYFFLIGMVMVILLLAPKYKTVVHETYSGSIGTETTSQPENSLANQPEEDYVVTAESFQAAPRDPLYLYDMDIDPRSPIFRGDKPQ